MTSVYTPDATGRCTVCARPEAEHSRYGGWPGDEARCAPQVTTVERCDECDPSFGCFAEPASCCKRPLPPRRIGDEERCMPVPVEVTNAQIRDLRDSFDEADDPDLALACDRALGLDSLDDCTEDDRLGIIETSRETCAAAINARAKGGLSAT